MQEIKATKIADGILFGEGVRWYNDGIVLSDMMGKRVVTVNPETGDVATLLEVPNQPNGLLVLEDDSLLITSMFDAKILQLKNGQLSEYIDLSSVVKGYLGDIVNDVKGNIYVDDVGARVLHGEEPKPGILIRISPEKDISIVSDQIAFPNGLVISGDGKRLYMAETMTSSIHEYPILEDATLGESRRVIDLTDTSRIDGLTMDEEDGIWTCMLDAEFLLRIMPNGDITHKIILDGVEPISATIGGKDNRTLFVSTINALKGKNIFDEMVEGRVRGSVWTAPVPYAKGMARP